MQLLLRAWFIVCVLILIASTARAHRPDVIIFVADGLGRAYSGDDVVYMVTENPSG